MTLLLALALFFQLPENLKFESFHTHEAEQVKIAVAKVDGHFEWVRGVFPVPAPAKAVFRLVKDYPAYPKTFGSFIGGVEVLKAEEASSRLRIIWPYPFPFKDRYGVVVYQHEVLADGSYLVSWQQDYQQGDKKMRQKRINLVAGRTVVKPIDANQCEVTYIYQGDLGGDFSGFAKKRAWRGQALRYRNDIFKALNLDTN